MKMCEGEILYRGRKINDSFLAVLPFPSFLFSFFFSLISLADKKEGRVPLIRSNPLLRVRPSWCKHWVLYICQRRIKGHFPKLFFSIFKLYASCKAAAASCTRQVAEMLATKMGTENEWKRIHNLVLSSSVGLCMVVCMSHRCGEYWMQNVGQLNSKLLWEQCQWT